MNPLAKDLSAGALTADGPGEAILRREVLPHATDGWYIPDSVKIGYTICLTRYFYKLQPLRTREEIRADVMALGKETDGMLGEIIGGSVR